MLHLHSAIKTAFISSVFVFSSAMAGDVTLLQKQLIENAVSKMKAPLALIEHSAPSFYADYLKKVVRAASGVQEMSAQDKEHLAEMLWQPFGNSVINSKTLSGEWDYREKLIIEKNGSYRLEYYDYKLKLKYVIVGVVSGQNVTVDAIQPAILAE